jgi:peroxiredoxin
MHVAGVEEVAEPSPHLVENFVPLFLGHPIDHEVAIGHRRQNRVRQECVQETSADDVRAYAERYQLDYEIGADLTGEVFRNYRLWGLPTQFFVGPDGVIRSVVLAPLTEAGAQAQVEAILPKN